MKKDLTKIRKEEEKLYKNFLIVRNEYIYTNNKNVIVKPANDIDNEKNKETYNLFVFLASFSYTLWGKSIFVLEITSVSQVSSNIEALGLSNNGSLT